MNFGFDKSKTLNIEKGKASNGNIMLPNVQIIHDVGEGETYKYFGFLQDRLFLN